MPTLDTLEIGDADALIIVPPFAASDCPSLAAHLLQACAAQRGLRVRVLYANLAWAAELGEDVYMAVCRGAPYNQLSGERQFANAAFGLPLPTAPASPEGDPPDFGWSEYQRAAARAAAWADHVASAVAASGCRVVGSTITFEQTLASIALLDRVKRLRPEIVTILGGGNCQGDMAKGLALLPTGIDHIFSGESERTFVDFLLQVTAGARPRERIVRGSPCTDLDALPTPDFGEFFAQRRHLLPESQLTEGDLWLHCESSRGCWWGQKHPCTFCGFNGETMQFRERSPGRVVEELKAMAAAHPTRKVLMADNIMPHTYFRTLLPRLAAEVPGLDIYYELKANLTIDQCLALKAAGARNIQPGIEALSSSLLRRMDKGLTAAQAVRLLRYGRAVALNVAWNLLHDFPGDLEADYEETLALTPLLRHLQPPVGFHRLTLDRFSPYFEHPERYGVARLTPQRAYTEVFPPGADIAAIAYHFDGDYTSAARRSPALMDAIRDEIARWREAWQRPSPPTLEVRKLTEKAYFLVDRRGLPGAPEGRFLSRDEASALLVPRRMERAGSHAWAIDARLAVALDGWFVPLPTAAVDVLRTFEAERPEEPEGAVKLRGMRRLTLLDAEPSQGVER